MARRRQAHWGFGDIAQPATADQEQQAAQVALQTISQVNPAPGGGNQIHDATEKLKLAMIQTAIEIAAVQLAVSIMLKTALFVVPIGTIIGTVLSVIDIFTGAYAKRKVKEIIAAAVSQIQGMTQAVQADLQVRAQAVADQEWANAQTIAASGVPLSSWESLDGWWDDIVHAVAKPILKLQGGILKVAGDVGLTSASTVLKLVGDSRDASKVAQKQQEWTRYVNAWNNHLVVLSGDPDQLLRDVTLLPAEYLLGTAGIETAKKKCAALVQAAQQQLGQMHDAAVATMATPAYAQQVRVNLAALIAGDPDMLAKAQQLAQIDQEADAALGQVQQAATQGKNIQQVSSASGTGIFGIMSMAALWAMLA